MPLFGRNSPHLSLQCYLVSFGFTAITLAAGTSSQPCPPLIRSYLPHPLEASVLRVARFQDQFVRTLRPGPMPPRHNEANDAAFELVADVSGLDICWSMTRLQPARVCKAQLQRFLWRVLRRCWQLCWEG